MALLLRLQTSPWVPMAPACVHMPNGGGNFVVFLNLLEVDLDGPMLVLTYPYNLLAWFIDTYCEYVVYPKFAPLNVKIFLPWLLSQRTWWKLEEKKECNKYHWSINVQPWTWFFDAKSWNIHLKRSPCTTGGHVHPVFFVNLCIPHMSFSFGVEVQLREMALWQCMTFEKVGKRWEFYRGVCPNKNGGILCPHQTGKLFVKSSTPLGAFLVRGGGSWPVSLTKIPIHAF